MQAHGLFVKRGIHNFVTSSARNAIILFAAESRYMTADTIILGWRYN